MKSNIYQYDNLNLKRSDNAMSQVTKPNRIEQYTKYKPAWETARIQQNPVLKDHEF